MWIDAFETKFEGKDTFKFEEDWDKLLGHCMAVTDAPGTMFWQELLAAYPDRKIILTERDSPEQHYDSFMSTLYPYFKRYHIPTWNPLTLIYRALCPKDSYTRMNDLNCRYARYETFPQYGRQRYLDHNAVVKEAVPKDRLLVFNVKEGWEPLCKFLGKPIPSSTFPRGNSKEDMREIMRQGMAATDIVVAKRLASIVGVMVAVGGNRLCKWCDGSSICLGWTMFVLKVWINEVECSM